MRSFRVIAGQTGFPSQFDNLRHDARGASFMLGHQQLGALALPTAPTNSQTLTLTINGVAIVLTAVGTIGSAAGNVLNPGTAAGFAANVLALLNQPQTTTGNAVALSAADQQFLSYLSFSLVGTTITISSSNNSLYAPLTSFTAATTVTGASWTAQTMQLYVEPGVVYVNGTRVIFAGGSTPTVTAPSSHPRIDVLTVDNTGTLAWTTGTENASPSAPTYPADKVALCELYNVVGETALYDLENEQSGQGYISNDVRAILGMPFNPGAIPDSLIPSSASTLDLGSSGNPWRNIYGNGSNLTGINTSYAGLTGFLAAEAVAANAAVAAGYYQSDGGIMFDTTANGSVVTSGGVGTISFTVASNSNRLLLVFLSGSGNISPPGGLAYNGVSMTGLDSFSYNASDTGAPGASAILVAPSTGTNNLTFSGSTTATYYYYIVSLYNCAQSGQPDNHGTVAGTGTSATQTLSIVPNNYGEVIVSASSTSATGSIQWENTGSNTGMHFGDSGKIFPLESMSVSWTGSTGWTLSIAVKPYTAASLGYVVNASASNASTGYTDNYTGYRSSAFIGFVNASAIAGGSVTVALSGVLGSFSSLLAGAQYYLSNTGGAIATTAGSITRKLGIAISTTQLVVTNIW
jgi:hypothetical protein